MPKIIKLKYVIKIKLGRRPKLTLPILAHIYFLHKMTHNFFAFKIQNDQTKIDRPIFGRSAAIRLTKTAHHMGPNYIRWQFFSKNIPSLNFDFVQENVLKSQNCLNLGRLADTPICPKKMHCGAPNT